MVYDNDVTLEANEEGDIGLKTNRANSTALSAVPSRTPYVVDISSTKAYMKFALLNSYL